MDDLLSFGEVSESDEDKFLSDPFGQGAIKSKETVVEKKVTEVQGFQGISLGLSDDDGGDSDIGDLFGKKKQVQEKKDDNVVQQVVSERQQTSNVTEVTKPKFDEIETFQESDNLNDSSNLSNLNFNKENDKTVTQSNVTGLTGLTGLSGLQNTEPTVSSTSNVTGLTGLTGLNNLSNLNGPAVSSESQSKSQSKTSATENYKFTGLTGLTGLNSGTTSAGLTGLNNLINLNSNLNLGSDSKFSINQNISKESSTNNIKDHSNFTLNFGSNNIQTGTNGVTGTNTSSIMKPPDFKSLMSVQTDTADAGGKGGNGDIKIQNHNDNTSSNTNSGTSTSVEKFNFNFESSSSVTQPQVTGTDKKDVFNPFGNLNLKIQTQQQPQTNFQDTTVTGANANSNTSNFGTGLTGLTGLNNLSSQSTTMTNSTTGPSTYKPLTGLSLSNLNTNVTNEKNPSSNITDSTIVQPSLSMQLNQNTDVFNPFGNSSILTGGINGSGSKDNATALTTLALGGGKNNLNLVGLMNLSTGTTAETNSIKKADEAGVATAAAVISKESTGLKTDLKNFDISAIINQNQNQNQNSNTSKTSTTLNTVTVKDPFNPFGSSSNNVNVPSSTGPSNMKFDFKEALKIPTNPISTTTVTTAVVEPVVKVEPIKVNEGREEESVADSKVKDDDNKPQAEESEDEKSKTYDFGFDDEDDDDEAAANQDGKSAGVGVGNVDTSSSGNKEVMESLTKFKPANDIATVVEKTKPSSTNILDNLKNSLNMVNLNSNTTSAASAAAATTTSVTNTVTESDNDTLGQSILNLPVTVDETQQMTTNTDSLKTDTVTSNFDGDNAPVVTVTVDTESESNVTAKDTATSVNVQPNGPNLLNNVNPLSIVTGPPMSLTPTNPQLNTITNQQSVPVPGQPLQSQIKNQILKQGEHKAQGPGPTSSSASTSQHVHRSKNAEPTSNMLIVESEEDARRAMIEQNKLASAKKSARSQNQNNGIQQGGASPSHKFRSDSTDPVPEQVATMTSQSEAQLYSDEFDAESDGGKFPEVVPSKNSTVSGKLDNLKDSLNNSKQSNSLSNSVKSQSQSQGKGSNAGGSAKASNINDKAAATKGNSNRPNSGSVTANKSQNGSKESIQNSSKSSSKGSQQGALKQKGPGPNKPNLAAAPQNLQQQQQNLTNSSSTTATDSNTQLSQSVTVSATGNSASTSNAHPNSVLASAAAAERQHGAFTSGPRQGPQTGGGSSGTRSLTRTGAAGAGSNGPPQRPQPKQFSTRGGHHHIQQSHGGTGQVSQQHPSDSTLTQSQSSTNGNTVTSQKESESKLSGLFGQDSATEYKRIAQQALSNGNSNPNQRGRNHIQKNIQQATRRVYSTHQNPNHIPTSANNVGASATVNIESQSLPPTNNHQQTQSTQQSQQQQPVNVHLISKNTNPKQSKAAINALQQGFSQQLQMNTLVPGDPTPNQNNPNTSAPVVKPLMVLSLPMSPAAVQRGYQIIWRKCLSPQARRREIIRNQQTLAQKQLEAQCRAELNSQIKKPRLVNNKLVGDPQANDQQVRELAAKTANLETGNVLSAMKGYGDIYRSPRGQIQQGQQAQGGGVASGLVVPTGPGDQNLPQMSATMGAQPQGFQQPAIQQSNLSATMGGPVPLNGQNQQIQLQNNNWAGNQNGVPQSQSVTVSQTQNDGTSMNSLSSTMQGPQISVAPLTQAQLAALSPAQLQQLQQQQAQQQQMLLQQQQLQLQMAAQQAQQQQQLLQAQQQQAQQLQQNTTAQSQAQQTQSSQSQSQSQSIPPLNPNSAFAQILILTPRSALARARKRQVQRELQYMAQNPERLKKVEEIRKEKERLKHEKQLNDELIKRRKEEERIKNRQMYEEYISKKHKDQDRIKKQEKESRQKREKDDIQFIQLQKEAYEREKNERLEKVRKNREGGHKKARFPRFNDEITLTQLENGQVALGLSPTSHGMQNNLNRQHLVSPVNPLMGGNGNVIQVPNNGTTITTAAAVVTPPVLPNTSVNNDGGGGVQDQLQGNIDSDQTGLL